MYFAFKDTVSLELIITRNTYVFFSIVLSFYLLTKFIFPTTLIKKQFFLLILEISCLVVFNFLVYYVINYSLNVAYPEIISKPTILTNFARGAMVMERALCFATPYWFFRNYLQGINQTMSNLNKKHSLQKAILNAELSELKNQINPHFLYNTLNFLFAQALPISSKLSKSILSLSCIMRYAIRENDMNSNVFLEEEVTYVQNYIQLENLQNSKNKNTFLNITGNIKYRRVTPLALQPILDFSYRYGDKIFFNLDIKENQINFLGNIEERKSGEENSINEYFKCLELTKSFNSEYFLSKDNNSNGNKLIIELRLKS